MAAKRWLSILPQVFDLLLNDSERIVDDTSIERLLVWLEEVCSTSDGLKILLKRETHLLTFLSNDKLVEQLPCCIGVSFAFRLCGILWSNGYNVDDSSKFFDVFAKSRENENLWNEAIVRHAYFIGFQSLTSSSEGQKWLQEHKECLLTAVACIGDSSMFVAAAARELIAKFLIASWSMNISSNDNGYLSEMNSLLELLQKNLSHNELPNDSDHQRMISDQIVSVLDIVRILLNTNFEVGQEILCMSKVFANCVKAVEVADQNVCRKFVDVVNGFQLNSRSQYTIDWVKLLSCDSIYPSGDKNRQSAQTILLTIPIKWYKKGMISLALDFIAGLSLPNGAGSRSLSAVWPEILACLINATIEVLMEKCMEYNCNGSSETNTSDIDSLVAELLSLENVEDLDNNIKRVKKQIQRLVEPWMLNKKCQVDSLLQILYTIKELVTKDAPRYSQHLVQWIEFSLTILVNSAIVSNGDEKLLALDVKGNVKVVKITLSVITVLLPQLLQQPNLTDPNRNKFFHVLNTAILVARSSRTDPTVITNTLECIGILLDQGFFHGFKDVTDEDSPGVFAYYQRTKDDLGSLIHLRLRDQRWEIKDSALEFVARLLQLNSEAFLGYVVNPSILSLVWASVDDSESYVRSTAWCCIGHLACNPSLWAKLKEKEHFTEFAVLKKIVHVLENESEAFPRRGVMDCLIKWSRDQHPIVNAVLPKPDKMSEKLEPKLSSSTRLTEVNNADSEIRSVFSDIIRYAFKDFDWEVKIRALQLIETFIQIFSTFRDRTPGADICNESSRSQPTLLDNHYTMNNLMALLVDLGAAVPLLEAVIDCDSLVCEKALKVISILKALVHTELSDTRLSGSNKTGSSLEKPNKTRDNNEPIATPEQVQDVVQTSEVFSVETFHVILYRIDVSSLTTLCNAIDINVQKDPAGFLDDILLAARTHGDNLLDCY